ncbi:JAB domain-containing protein [Cellulomonas denverensis]|uniref:UPF0758 domain-containing protein n=1 Tax=Cellulomonas denverensis TaxID=264297 RepID=A0A7X6KWF1_9CELL|nr:UPF0758 domain-containing protein [Cellulomonas denverensis]NKY23400.1 hypothetical protein [Cellulomonas denverensis]GIG25119.1 hypothetical protein Cde04nite_13630 [Cellulomonas denverensis]
MTSLLADTDPWDRPRERMLRLGADALSDVELVALLLGSGRRGSGVLDCAQDLLATHGGLSGLADQDSVTLTAVPGVGPAKATRLVAALALARRFGTSTDRRQTVRGPDDIRRVAAPLLAGVRDDRVAVIAADRASRVLGTTVLADVRAHDRPVPVRLVLAAALRHGAVTFALAHRCTARPDGGGAPGTPSPGPYDHGARGANATTATGRAGSTTDRTAGATPDRRVATSSDRPADATPDRRAGTTADRPAGTTADRPAGTTDRPAHTAGARGAGSPDRSAGADDREFTALIANAAGLCGLRLLDHVALLLDDGGDAAG